ncbi:MAG: RidA family protein [Lentisphaeria bacterium]|nr:RidA family protein [Lentisphaeria bacterium]
MSVQAVQTDNAPAAIGPYSQATIANGTVYVSGQLPIDPSNGELCKGSVSEQTKFSLSNVKAILEAAGSSLDKVVRCDVFLKDMGDFVAMNEVYAEFFSGEVKPARQAIEAARLPKDADVEISCIAVLEA